MLVQLHLEQQQMKTDHQKQQQQGSAITTTRINNSQNIIIVFPGCTGTNQQGRQRTDCNEGDGESL